MRYDETRTRMEPKQAHGTSIYASKRIKTNFLWQHQVPNPLPLDRDTALNLFSGFFREMGKLRKRSSKIRRILAKDRHLHPKQQAPCGNNYLEEYCHIFIYFTN